MTDDKKKALSPFERAVKDKEQRKMRVRGKKGHNPFLGFGLFGLIGWSVAVPALLGIVAGLALDRHHPGRRSWTLMLFVGGVLLGCWNAWYWVRKEHDEIDNENK